ncbi:29033_t:CDS:1, partial [Gigaspora margarita]
MSEISFSPHYYEFLEQIKKSGAYFKDMPIDEVKKQIDNTSDPAPIPENITINEVKLDEKYRMKSKEYLVDGLKIYEDVIDEKWKDFDD